MTTPNSTERCPAIRPDLPPQIRSAVGRPDRGRWASHPNFAEGQAGFWMHVHDMLRNGAQRLLDLTTAARPDPAKAAALIADARGVAAAVTHLTTRHHTIEDRVYFPQMVRARPKLAAALDLLEDDHGVLESTLAELASSFRAQRTVIDERQLRITHDAATQFHRALNRHLTDEEDVVIPLLLAPAA